MRNIRSIYPACTNVCNLVIVFATLFYLFFALFYCNSLSGVQLKELSLTQTGKILTILTKTLYIFQLKLKSLVLTQDMKIPLMLRGHIHTWHFCRAIVSISMSEIVSIKSYHVLLRFSTELHSTSSDC